MKRLVNSILAGILTTTMSLNVMADKNAVTSSSGTTVTIEIEEGGPTIGDNGPLEDGNIISITVPSVLPFIFNKNGSTTVPTDWSVRNYSEDDIVINNIYFDGNDDWDIHQVENDKKPGEYLLDKGKDYKTIEVFIGEAGRNNTVSIGDKYSTNNIKNISMVIDGVDEVSENNYNSKTLEFKVYRTPFTTASNEYGAYTMHIDFGFYVNMLNKDFFNNVIKDKSSIYFGGDDSMLNDPTADDLSGNRSIVGLDVNGKYHIVSDDVIYAPEDSSYLFADCEADTIVFGEYFDTSTAITLDNMFDNCSNLRSVTLGENFGQVNNITNLFNSNITVINPNNVIKEQLDSQNISTRYNTISKDKFRSTDAKTMKSIHFDNNHIVLSNSSAIDLSEAQDGSIMGVDIGNGEFHVSSHSTIYAPEDCSGFFNQMLNATFLDLTNFNTSNTIDMDYMFSASPLLITANLQNLNTSNVTNMHDLFNNCKSLQSIDLSNFNTSNVENMCGMFTACHSLESITFGDNWNTQKVTTMQTMFATCNNLKEIDLHMFNTENVTSMYNMFTNCYNLTMLDLSSFDTTMINDLTYLAPHCNNLKTIILGPKFGQSYNSKAVFGVGELTETLVINANEVMKNYNWTGDKRQVTFKSYYENGSLINKEKLQEAIASMPEIYFEKCTINLESLNDVTDLSDNQDMSIVGYKLNDREYRIISDGKIYAPENCYMLFGFMHEIEVLDLSNFDTTYVTNMNRMFRDLYNLTDLNLGDNFYTSRVTDMTAMFDTCSKLTTLDLSTFDTRNIIPDGNRSGVESFSNYNDSLQTIILNENFGQDYIMPNNTNKGLFFRVTNSKNITIVNANKFMREEYDWLADNLVVTFK